MTTLKNNTAVLVAAIVCATLVVFGLITGFVVLVLYAPPGTDLVKLLGAIGTGLALVAGQAVQIAKQRSTDRKVDYLANGGTDAKTRAGVADVVRPEFLKPEYLADQLEADQEHRAATPANGYGNGSGG